MRQFKRTGDSGDFWRIEQEVDEAGDHLMKEHEGIGLKYGGWRD
jgi:hypothetical protein